MRAGVFATLGYHGALFCLSKCWRSDDSDKCMIQQKLFWKSSIISESTTVLPFAWHSMLRQKRIRHVPQPCNPYYNRNVIASNSHCQQEEIDLPSTASTPFINFQIKAACCNSGPTPNSLSSTVLKQLLEFVPILQDINFYSFKCKADVYVTPL